jgi:beta-carotene hydroxylase
VSSLGCAPRGRMSALHVPPVSELGGRLLCTSRPRRIWTLTRPLVWVAIFAFLAQRGWWVAAVAVFPALFVSQVVALNDVMHRSIGLGTRATELAVALLGLLVLESGHAIRVTHLAHHEQGGGENDPESYVDLLPLGRLVAEMPRYRFRIWAYGWRHGHREERRWIGVEVGVAMAVVALTVIGVAPEPALVFVGASILAGWAFPLVSAVGPHVDWGRDKSGHAYRVRGRWLPRLMLNLPFHLEHHLYPEVPSHRLPELTVAVERFLEPTGIKEVRVW